MKNKKSRCNGIVMSWQDAKNVFTGHQHIGHFHNSSSQLNLKARLRPLYYGQYIGLCGRYCTFTNMVAAFPPCSRTQPHLVSTPCSHAFAFLATAQLNWSNWGLSESSKGTSTVAAEGWENITHSFKPASQPQACLSNLQANRPTVSHLCICMRQLGLMILQAQE